MLDDRLAVNTERHAGRVTNAIVAGADSAAPWLEIVHRLQHEVWPSAGVIEIRVVGVSL